MKVQKTVKIKIGKLSKTKQKILDVLLDKNVKAINFCLNEAKKGEIITHRLVYKELRKMDLPATVIHECRRKSVEIIKSCNKRRGKKKFPQLKHICVRYDKNSVKLRKTNNQLYKYFISLLYKAGTKGMHYNRIELPLIINADYQTNIVQKIGNEYKLGTTELIKKRGNYFAHITYSKEIEIPLPDGSFSPSGVDIGINNLAVSVAQSSVKFYSGRRIKWKNKFFRRQRTKLQKIFALQEIKRLKGRQANYNRFHIHNIAKGIIKQAKQEINQVIVMENLRYVTETKKVIKQQKAEYYSWIFRKLQDAIEYKANWEGIPVVHIDAYNSSKICSRRGNKNKRNKHVYKCKSCGYEANADYTAGRNLQQFFKTKCFEKQAPINSASNEVTPKLKAKKDNFVRNLETEKCIDIIHNSSKEFYGGVIKMDLSHETISKIFSEQLRRLPIKGGDELRQP